jgi:hypothetical protein
MGKFPRKAGEPGLTNLDFWELRETVERGGSVAQICNLLYRRIAFGRRSKTVRA